FTATMDIPNFNRAAMDGYAVKYKDTFGAGQFKPKVLKIIGVVHAGIKPAMKIKTGECVQISTGAMMPAGADAVMMVEDTEREGDTVRVFKSIVPASNVGKQGEDIKTGAAVLKEGTFLDAGKIGVLASHGLTKVTVYAKPNVAILPTGEEVVAAGKKLQPGQLYDINSHTISAVIKDNGGLSVSIGISGDTREALKATIKEALKNDIVVLSGGSSVGERDLLVDVIEGWGEVLFHGVQVRPGKPTIFAIIEGKPVMGMPGYPTSCLINAYLFLMPALRKMAHLPLRHGDRVEAKLSRRVSGSTGRRQFLTVKIVDGEAVPVFKESGAITSIANAEGYIEIPENIDLLEKGEPVTVVLF
ncbi:MAG: molybdopterin-binding protein, partial [Dehalococcoidales bacterium]|nr:molybdopterin-binding protein [Dehalococcoidales bacterium]